MAVSNIKYVLMVVFVAVIIYWIAGYWTNSVDLNVYYRNKRIVLTGASRGIGRELAVKLATAGAELLIVARSKDLLESTAKECLSVSDSKVHTLVADVGAESDCKMIAEEAVNKMNGVDILIVNAAYSPLPSFFNQIDDPDKLFTNVFRVNLFQSVNLVHFLLPSLIEAEGHIIAVSSGASLVGMPQVAAYSSSKHALNGFFKALRQEFTIQGIKVDITVMPLPYVLTKKAVDNWRPIGDGGGITSEVCADSMIKAIPSRQPWVYIDWSMYIISLINNVFPNLTEYFVRTYIANTSFLFSE